MTSTQHMKCNVTQKYDVICSGERMGDGKDGDGDRGRGMGDEDGG